MRVSTTAFNWLLLRDFKVGTQKEPGRPPVCHGYDNPFLAIAKFARFVGLTSIPAKTIEMLKTDPCYKYCFYVLTKSFTVYRSPDSPQVQERLKAILLKPELFNDHDLYFGLREYLNNFALNMPKGGNREQFANMLDDFPRLAQIFNAVDSVLGADKGKALVLFDEANQERYEDDSNFTKRAEYLRLSLSVFDTLVKSQQFSPQELWA
jgi:hypothetical protein